ncbi:MAG: glycosyltransferase family 39 protein [Candidatus Dormibacteria bacterium]|jgi:hypothetical protein
MTTALRREALIGLLALLLVAGFVRLFEYTTTPEPAQNRDELAWAWTGQSLLETGTPSSWSYLPAYPAVGVQLTFDGTYMPYVHDWLDHPPLFALLVGGVAIDAGETTPQSVTPEVIRILPLLLSLLTLCLLFFLTRELVGDGWAWLAAVLFAFSPWMVEMSHLVEAESLLAPMLLGALLLLLNGRGHPRRQLVWLLALCLLAPLVKVVGVSVGISVAVLLLLENRWRAAVAAVAAAVAGLLVYVAYGVAVNSSLFWSVIHAQGNRHGSFLVAGWEFLLSLRASLGFFVPLHDPFWYVGLLAVAAVAVFWWDRRAAFLVVPVAVYSAVMAATGPDRTGELVYDAGWYRITVYPLLFAAIAVIVSRLWAARHLTAGAPPPAQADPA